MLTSELLAESDPLQIAFDKAKTALKEKFPDYSQVISQNDEAKMKNDWSVQWNAFQPKDSIVGSATDILLGVIALAVLTTSYKARKPITAPAMLDIIEEVIKWWTRITSA